MEQFRKDYVKAHLGDLDPEERLKGLRAEERLKGLRVEERLNGLEAQERLRGLKVEEIEAYLDKLKKNSEN